MPKAEGGVAVDVGVGVGRERKEEQRVAVDVVVEDVWHVGRREGAW